LVRGLIGKGVTPDQIALTLNTASNFKAQMDADPSFENVPLEEKILMSAAYGIVSGKLEKYGLTKSLSKSPLGRNLNAYILKSVFSQLPKGASAEAVETAVESTVKGLIAKGILNTASASFIEGSTEAAQEIADMTLKEAYNEIKGKDYFDNPKTFTEALGRASESFQLGMIGGAMMNGTTHILQTPRNLRSVSQLKHLESIVENPDAKAIFENNLKAKVISREITPAQAKSQIQEMNESQALFDKIPKHVSDKYESFNLLSEKQELEQQIAGKDPVLAAPQKERIAEIDQQLYNISQDALQKQKSAGISVQPETKSSGTVQETQSEPELKSPTEQSTEETIVQEEVKPSEIDTLIEAETIPERRSTLQAVKNVETALGDTKVIVHQNSEDYASAINEFVADKESDNNRTSARFIPSRNEIHIDLDTAEPLSAYHEAFHAKIRNIDKSTLSGMVSDLRNVVKDDENLLEQANQFALNYGDSEISEETLAELTGLMANTATKLDKTNLQKFIEFINKIATKIGLPSILNKAASKGEVVNFVNDLSASFREGRTTEDVANSDTPIVSQDSSRKITPDRLAQMQLFDESYNKLIEEGSSPTDAFDKSMESVEAIQDDIKREEAIRDINRRYGKKVKAAPKAEKVIGKKKPKMVLVDDAKALVSQIKLEAKAAQQKKKQIQETLATISDTVKAMESNGKISVRQMKSILSAMKGLNMDNKVAVDRFIDYVGKAISDAQYVEKVGNAISIRKTIKRSFKGKSNPFVAVAKGFSEINPKWVENIDEYLDIAGKVKESLRPTRIQNGEIKFKQEADIQEVGKYTAREQERQNKVTEENIRNNYERITGKKADGRPAGELLAEMNSEEFIDKPDYTDEVRQVLRDTIDQFYQVITSEDPKEVQDAVKINVDILDNRTAIKIIDALDSYIANGSTAGLRAQMASYKGIEKAKNSTLKSAKLRLAGNAKLGRFQNEQFTNLNIMTERIFRGARAGLQFREESGLQGVINGSAKAETNTVNKQNEYLKKFGKIKNFNSAENIFERNIIAFLRRNTTNGDQQSEFNRRKKLLEDSVAVLKKGNKDERNKADFYRKAIDKLNATSEETTIQDIERKASKSNVEAVDFVTNMWSELYPELSDFALGVHNIMLPRDSNYTPDRYATLSNKLTVEETIDQKSFGLGAFSNFVLDKNEAGVLVESTRPKTLPKGRYVDLDFDTNMFRAYKLALTDMYTAESIEQAYSYLKSPEFDEMVDVDDANILKAAISDYVSSKKGGKYSDKDTFDYFRKTMNYIGALGAGRALAGFGQAINQYSTATMNTFINAGVNLHPWDIANKEAMEFVSKSGRGIANRGLESVTTIENADNVMKKAFTGSKVVNAVPKFIAKVNEIELRWLLSKPDVAAARTAWLAYYRKSMKEQGLEVSYNPKDLNDKAADYAQAMVDRNMDVSDTELRGKFFKDKAGYKVFMKQIFFPFATFALNQKNRMYSDFSTVFSPTASNKDRFGSMRSLSALTMEAITYNYIGYSIGKMILDAAMESFDLDDEEKKAMKDKYIENMKRNQISKAVKDFVSPSPVFDNWTLIGVNKLIKYSGFGKEDEKEFDEMIKAENEKRFNEYKEPLTEEEIEKKRLAFHEKEDFQFFVDDAGSMGIYAIQYEKVKETMDMYRAWNSGEYTQETKYGEQEKKLTKEGQEKMLLPFLLKFGGASVLPREADQAANRMFKIVKDKYGITETQAEKIEELKKLGYKEDEAMVKLVKAKSGAPRTVEGLAEHLEYIKTLSESELKEYWKGVE